MSIEDLKAALAPLVAIADAYDASNLDEHRPEWGTPLDPNQVELYTGRGGKRLLTLEHCLAARRALQASKVKHIETIQTFMGVRIDQIKKVLLTENHGRYPSGSILNVVKVIPHGGNYDCEAQFLVDDGSYIPCNKAEPV